MKLQFRISQRDVICGERMPPGYRIAWFDIIRGGYVAYPIGIHWIARAIYLLWAWTFRYRPCALERLLCKARQADFDAGYEAGKEAERLYNSGFSVKLEPGPLGFTLSRHRHHRKSPLDNKNQIP